MSQINIEIKAKCADVTKIRQILKARDADFKGTDHQIDTYFKIPHGRMKLRQGNIENCLIHYVRENIEGPKQSNVTLYQTTKGEELRGLLTKAIDVLVVVDKQREIYFIQNIKFHVDVVQGLGSFVEIEAIDQDGSIGREKLLEQCNEYMQLFEIKEDDLLNCSYSDLLMAAKF